MKIPIFPGKYHQNGGFSRAMLVYRRVDILDPFGGDDVTDIETTHFHHHRFMSGPVWRFFFLNETHRFGSPVPWEDGI